MRKYIIYDSTGTKVAILTTLKDALDFKHIKVYRKTESSC